MRCCKVCKENKDVRLFHPATIGAGAYTCLDCAQPEATRAVVLGAFDLARQGHELGGGGAILRELAAHGLQYCPKCAKAVPLAEFHASSVGAPSMPCKACKRVYNQDNYRARGPEVAQNKHRKRAYGLEPGEYAAMLKSQAGGCACCRTDLAALPSRQVHVEHEHKTGKIRGITCMRCNIMIGFGRDDPNRLRAVADYLEK